MPFDVKDVIVGLFKRMYGGRSSVFLGRGSGRGSRRRLAGLGAPELDGPVDRASQEQVREIDGAGRRVEVQARDWAGMAAVHVLRVEPSLD